MSDQFTLAFAEPLKAVEKFTRSATRLGQRLDDSDLVLDVEDVVDADFIKTYGRPRDYSMYREKWLRKRPEIEASYRINEPRESFCMLHQKFCLSTLIYEVSYREEFRRFKYLRLCQPAVLLVQEKGRYVRKWQVPASALWLGEENMQYEDFCYYHLAREGRRIQTRQYTDDVAAYVQACPMCDEAHEELTAKGFFVEVYCA